jgi:4-amino-4-deoxy-L-arabinose transferase-like glycosyltransferase
VGDSVVGRRTERPASMLPRVLAVLAVIVLAFPIRGLELDRVVTPDEPLWLGRSANFRNAVAHGDLDATYQNAHPGVTVMWLGALSLVWSVPDYGTRVPGQISERNVNVGRVLTQIGVRPLDAMVAARRTVVVAIVLVLAAFAWYAMRLWGTGVGFFGAVLVVLDPFHTAVSRMLHLDGLFSCLLALATVSWSAFLLDGRRRRDVIVAGVALGLAGLTRSLAVSLVPMIIVSAIVEGLRVKPRWRIGFSIAPVVAIGGVAAVTFVMGWPALWSSPIDTLDRFVAGTVALGGEPHGRVVFFNRDLLRTDPGVWFYPISLLWRASPPVLLGIIPAVIALVVAARSDPKDRRAQATAYLALGIGCVLGILTASEKKLDRYVVALVPMLGLFAAYGWAAVAQRVRAIGGKLAHPLARVTITIGAAGMLLLCGWLVVVAHPYGFTYYNPMLGGAPQA